jgi:ketosteroid isomerase-like protein
MSRQMLVVTLLTLTVVVGCAGSETRSDAKPAVAKETKKEPLETAPGAAPEKTVKAVTAAIDAWASAWEKRDADAYLAAYGKDFKPEQGTRKQWEKQRRERLAKAKSIRVTVGNPTVTAAGPDDATATFTQIYESDKFSDQSRKTLELRKVDGKWLIVSETSK